MSSDPLSPDAAVHRITAALERAAQRARHLAAQTGTRLVVVRDGRLVREPVRMEDVPRSDGDVTEAPGS